MNYSKIILNYILAICFLTSAPIAANAAEFYLGASIGLSEYDELDSLADDGSFIAADIDDEDTGIRLFAGAEINPNFSIEIGHVDLGEFTVNALSDGSGILYAPGGVAVDVSGDGIDLSFIGKVPVGVTGSLNARIGVFMWDADARLADTTGSLRVSDDGSDVFFALGGEYRLSKNLGLRGEYAMYDLDGDDVSLLSASLVFYPGSSQISQ